MALNVRVTWCGLKGMGNPILFWIPPQPTRDHDFFRPLGMEHFYDSFALVSQISVRRVQLAAHEVDPAPEQAVSEGDASALKGVKVRVTRIRMTLLLH